MLLKLICQTILFGTGTLQCSLRAKNILHSLCCAFLIRMSFHLAQKHPLCPRDIMRNIYYDLFHWLPEDIMIMSELSSSSFHSLYISLPSYRDAWIQCFMLNQIYLNLNTINYKKKNNIIKRKTDYDFYKRKLKGWNWIEEWGKKIIIKVKPSS